MSVCCKNIKIGGSPCEGMLYGRKDTEGIQLIWAITQIYFDWYVWTLSAFSIATVYEPFHCWNGTKKSVKDSQHLYKSKSMSFSNLHTVRFLAWYMRGRGCAVICEQSCDFIHPLFAWALCWWEGIKWYSREYLWNKISGERTLFLLRIAPWYKEELIG